MRCTIDRDAIGCVSEMGDGPAEKLYEQFEKMAGECVPDWIRTERPAGPGVLLDRPTSAHGKRIRIRAYPVGYDTKWSEPDPEPWALSVAILPGNK